jgi:hypothetical protein
MSKYACARTCQGVHVCVYVCKYDFVGVRVRSACVCVYIWSPVCMCVCVCVCVCVNALMCICVWRVSSYGCECNHISA